MTDDNKIYNLRPVSTAPNGGALKIVILIIIGLVGLKLAPYLFEGEILYHPGRLLLEMLVVTFFIFIVIKLFVIPLLQQSFTYSTIKLTPDNIVISDDPQMQNNSQVLPKSDIKNWYYFLTGMSRNRKFYIGFTFRDNKTIEIEGGLDWDNLIARLKEYLPSIDEIKNDQSGRTTFIVLADDGSQ